MNDFLFLLFILYFAVINIIAVSVTVYDKYAAKNDKWRIRESTLLLLAVLSSGFFEYLTMRLIHHKTRKLKFMLLIPLIFITEALLAIFAVYNLFGFNL